MNVQFFRWLFLAVLATIIVIGNLVSPITLGASAEWSNGTYLFAGGTNPWAIALAVVVIFLYLLLMYSPPMQQASPFPGVFRRFVAFWLDFVLAMIAVGPIVGILPTLTEWRRTGVFEWNFERTTHAAGDGWLIGIATTSCFVALIIYYAYPLIRRRPSPGACIAGYQIIADEDATITPQKAVLRTLLGFVATSAWYLAPFIARDRKQGKFWLDKVFDTRAVKVK
jgi:hypothetical protein